MATYATLAELRSYLTIADVGEDANLTIALETASRAVDAFCGRRFSVDTAATTRTFWPSSGFYLYLPPGGNDISETASLVVAVDRNDDGVAEETWASSQYTLEPLNAVGPTGEAWPYTAISSYYLNFPLATRRPPVQVTAKWGWPGGPPGAVKSATLIAAAEIWKLKDAPLGVAGFGEFGVVRVRDNPKVAGLLQPYRHGLTLAALA